jgi:hypothetical protein
MRLHIARPQAFALTTSRLSAKVMFVSLALAVFALSAAPAYAATSEFGEMDSMGEMGELGDLGELEGLMADLQSGQGAGAQAGAGIEDLEAFLASSDLEKAIGPEQAAELRRMYASKDLEGLASLLTSPDTQDLRKSIESGQLQKAVESGDLSQLQALLGEVRGAQSGAVAEEPAAIPAPAASSDAGSDLSEDLAEEEAEPAYNVTGDIASQFTRISDVISMTIG